MRVTEPNCSQLSVLKSESATWLAAIGTIAAVAVALFKDAFWRWWRRPVLDLSFHDDDTHIRNEKWEGKEEEGLFDGNACRNYLFIAKNTGRSTAKNARAFIEKLTIKDDNGNERIVWHHPTQLHWSGTKGYPAQDIYRGTSYFLDFIVLISDKMASGIFKRSNVSETEFDGRYVKPWVDTTRRGLPTHYVEEGEYIFSLNLLADNAERKCYTASFNFHWQSGITNFKLKVS